MAQTEYSNIIKKIAIENGKEIFLEPKKIKAFLLDHTKNEYKEENTLLLSILGTDCIKHINEAEDFAECKRFLLRRLNDEYRLSSAKGSEILDILFLTLRGVNLQPLDKSRKSIAKFQKCISIGYDADGSHIVGLKADGKVVAVGSNEGGQCNTQQWRNIIAVSAGSRFTAGLKSDGSLILAGAAGSEQSSVKGIAAVSLGNSHFVALRTDGFVDAIGDNDYGQCDTQRWRDIVAISAGLFHTVGLRGDGTVVATGHNDYGQCETQEWRDIVGVSAGFCHTVGIMANGTVVAAGDKDRGHCRIQHWKDIVAVSAGMAHTVGLKADGTVVVNGSNDFGQCNVQGWRNYIAVRAGLFNTVGLKADGTVVVCGDNKFGQCNTQSWRDIGLTLD